MLEELRSLACLASMRSDVTVEPGGPGCGWCFDWTKSRITLDAADLALRPADYNRALILHEAAHAAVTRIADMVPFGLLRDHAVQHLTNAIDDCRIETWLQVRLPGCTPWLKLLNDHSCDALLADPAGPLSKLAPQAFLLGLIHRWWTGQMLDFIPASAAAAIEDAWPHIKAAIACQPPSQATSTEVVESTYRAHPVSRCYSRSDFRDSPDGMEMGIRMAQHAMWTIVWQRILPILQRLIQQSGQQLPPPRPPRLNVVRMGGGMSGRGPKRPGTPAPSLDQLDRLVAPNGGHPYEQSRGRSSNLIDKLADSLLRFLTEETRLRYQCRQARGERLDLRVAMQYQADPSLHDKLWMRRIVPRKPDPLFVLIVDASGSMSGARANATFDSLVIIREVCLRTGIALGIIAFNDKARQLQSWRNPHAAVIPEQLNYMRNHCEGSTNMLAALRLGRDILSESPHQHRYLWLLSDGEPDERTETQNEIRRIKPELTGLLALGLGPETHALKTLIPGARTGLTPGQLPEVVTHLIQQTLLAA